MSTQAELVTVIQTESERLQQYLAALPQDTWTTPSACALWEVRDVVAHLIRVPNAYTLRITHGLQGDTSPPEGHTHEAKTGSASIGKQNRSLLTVLRWVA